MTIFVMHIHRQHCQGCGTDETFSRLYQAEEVARPGQAKKLLPCHSIGPMDPVHREELPYTHTPVCAACVNDETARIGHDIYQRWAETIQRKYSPAPAQPRFASSATHGRDKAPPPSLEDLA